MSGTFRWGLTYAILFRVPEKIVIDGNNLLYAIRDSGAGPALGRDTLVRHLERWAKAAGAEMILVFDGARPDGAMGKQLSSSVIDVRFGASRSADDVIVELIRGVADPATVRMVSDDGAIRHEAGLRRCRHSGALDFIRELFARPKPHEQAGPPPLEKPAASSDEAEQWKRTFGADEDDPFDGYGAMTH